MARLQWRHWDMFTELLDGTVAVNDKVCWKIKITFSYKNFAG